MNVAFVHDWIAQYAGSEAVVAAMMRPWPDAPLHTLFYRPPSLRGTPLADRRIVTSFLHRTPGVRSRHPLFLPLMPFAIEQFDLRGYDTVVSSSHAVAKGVLTTAEQLHVAYVHTPMRFAWDLYHDYLDHAGLARGLRSLPARWLLHRLRLWDRAAADRVDAYLANSRYVARRIRKLYRRSAAVLYPPVDTEAFEPAPQREDYYVTVNRLVPYKRIDRIAEAFRELDRPLRIIGDGPERDAVRRRCGGPVRWLGEMDRAGIAEQLARARAFVFAADEDFGIAPVEAQAAGAPVIALRRGGVRETVVEGETGVFYDEPSPGAIAEAVRRFERDRGAFDPVKIAAHAQRFSAERFDAEFRAFIDRTRARFDRRRP